jgi:hypothetical protein
VRNYNYTCWKNIVNYITNSCTVHAIYLLTHPLSVSFKAAWHSNLSKLSAVFICWLLKVPSWSLDNICSCHNVPNHTMSQ